MAEIFSLPSKNLGGQDSQITLCSWPVIISPEGKILVHISSSTGKYQFIWGRLDDSSSLRETAVNKATEVLGHKNISLSDKEPLCISWEIKRDGVTEEIVLFHYKAKLEDENNIWEAEWKSLSEIEELWKQDMLSSENVLIASKYFLEQ